MRIVSFFSLTDLASTTHRAHCNRQSSIAHFQPHGQCMKYQFCRPCDRNERMRLVATVLRI